MYIFLALVAVNPLTTSAFARNAHTIAIWQKRLRSFFSPTVCSGTLQRTPRPWRRPRNALRDDLARCQRCCTVMGVKIIGTFAFSANWSGIGDWLAPVIRNAIASRKTCVAWEGKKRARAQPRIRGNVMVTLAHQGTRQTRPCKLSDLG